MKRATVISQRNGKMSTNLLETPVGRLVAEQPGRSRVFERVGIDYCCGGRRTLADACREKEIDIDTVVRRMAGTEDR